MLDSYIPLLVLFALAGLFVLVTLLLSIFLGPKKYGEVKDDPFECGTIGTGGASKRIGVHFYLVAMIFILFDIEIVFLYPWAVNVVRLGWYGLWAVLPFILLLTLGLIYEWKRGVLDWS